MRQLAVALMLVGMALAGCIGSHNGEQQAALANVTDPNHAAPDNRSALIAFQETNKTETGAGGVDHTHDYWMGRARVTLFQAHTHMAPSTDDQNRAVAEFQVPQPGTVFESTGSIEFTISNPARHACEPGFTYGGEDGFVCTDHPCGAATSVQGQPCPDAPPAPADPTGGGTQPLHLRYQHASTSTWIDVGDITWGKPATIKITDPKQTDMPHSTASLWKFQVVSSNPSDTTLVFDAKADIVRGEGNIPPWPGHPSFYADKHVREIFRASVVGGDPGQAAKQQPKESKPVHPQKLISYGTRTLYVWANITSVDADPVFAPSTWYLQYSNSTARQNITSPFDKTNHSADKKEHAWVLPVDDGGMDSPYGDASRWTFELAGAFTPPAGPSCYAGCASYVVKYDLVVLATDVVPDHYDIYNNGVR